MYELHQILAWRMQWGDFWANLSFVIIDEAHRHRGIFGSHIALLLRRICSYYDDRLQFILSSATIGDASLFAKTLNGVAAVEIADDSSPWAQQTFRLYNPWSSGKSILSATADLIRDQVQSGMQTLCFTKSRNMAEITALRERSRTTTTPARSPSPTFAFFLDCHHHAVKTALLSRRYAGVVNCIHEGPGVHRILHNTGRIFINSRNIVVHYVVSL